MLPQIGDFVFSLNREYIGTEIVISAISSDNISEGLIAYDTSDGKHWLTDSSLSISLECICSLVDARLYWDMEHGFTYQSREWDPSLGWFYGCRQRIPFVPK